MTSTFPMSWDTERGFEGLFKEQFKPLYRYAFGLLEDTMQSEEVVQDVFLKLWQHRDHITIETNINAYLYRAVHNQCMNTLNHEKVKAKYSQFVTSAAPTYAESPLSAMQTKELQGVIKKAMLKIPEKCRTVFHLSRQDELSYKEIAAKLGLSLKTVENQMGKALKILRTELKDYLPLFMVVIAILKSFLFNNTDL
ncbi:RNA polymerase sigma-70 factor [Taibaiella sp. KBW10]|uniref:RNA polymerase sigma-70 factor n=1 Tax=Taibaiella sp. KBW10 TaxID=2153357 RepID=UPI000F596631|nr:RNA polymerase sigma-70 factor [Taibaiella sp. KBW10]RQO29704.1 RNA polymerase sigma-70 factor [Taibaiella sp. KBW10]